MPNPFGTSFRVILSMDSNDVAVFTIFDAAGKGYLGREERSCSRERTPLPSPPENISPGFYTMRIRGKTICESSKTD